MCPLFTVYQPSSLIAGPLPTIIAFKTLYQQVREEEGMALICLTRKRNLDRNDTVTVVLLPQMIGEEVFQGINSICISLKLQRQLVYMYIAASMYHYWLGQIFLSCISTA